MQWHDNVVKIIYLNLALYTLITKNYTTIIRFPFKILENENTKYWDRTLLRDQSVVQNRRGIMLIDKQKKRILYRYCYNRF